MGILSDTIQSTIPLNIYNESVLTSTLDKKNQLKQMDLANFLFKNKINIKEAIVSVLSNTGIAGFKFNIPQTEQMKLESDITDYYVDSNFAIQDHIARKPITITLTGLHGEYFYSLNQIEDTLAKVIPTMKLVEQFLPKLDAHNLQTAIKKQQKDSISQISKEIIKQTNAENFYNNNFYNFTSETSLNGIDLFKEYQNIYKLKSSQTRAYFFFEALWKADVPFTVETTYKRFDNMLIQSLAAHRDNNADITDFTITFKQLYIAESKFERIENAAARTGQQLAEIAKKGLDKGEKVEPV